jgi:hypothetical protein
MKLIIALAVLIASAKSKAKEMTVSEINSLYPFGDLDTDQFNYKDSEELLWKYRLPKIIGYMNGPPENKYKKLNFKKSDFSCTVEHNANQKSRYYIPTPSQYSELKAIRFLITGKKTLKEFDELAKISSEIHELKNDQELKKEEYRKNYKELLKKKEIEAKLKALNLVEKEQIREFLQKEFPTEKIKLPEDAFEDVKYKSLSEDIKTKTETIKGRHLAFINILIEENLKPLTKDQEINTIITKYFKEKLIEEIDKLREFYDDELLPYHYRDTFKEYIPDEKAIKEKWDNPKINEFGDTDDGRWYMYKQIWKELDELFYYKEDLYEWRITPKTTGILHKDGKPALIKHDKENNQYSISSLTEPTKSETTSIMPEKKVKFEKGFKLFDKPGIPGNQPSKISLNKSPKQSILFVYNKNKFECDEEKTILVWNYKDSAPDSQNFVVHTCYYKNNKNERIIKEKVVFICTHYKSKDDGFESRMNLGNEIIKYVKINHLDDNVILMGDLNAEIDEVATSLRSTIVRKNKENNYELFVPNPFIKDIIRFSEKTQTTDASALEIITKKNEIEKIKSGCKNKGYFTCIDNKQIVLDIQKAEDELKVLEKNYNENLSKKYLKEKESKIVIENEELSLPLEIWYESSIDKTESKIRIKEIDYFRVEFMKYIQGRSKDANDKCFEKFRNKVGTFTIGEVKNEDHQKSMKLAFIDWTNCHLRNGSADEGRYKNLLASLIETEKIDYILLKFKDHFKIVSSYKIDNYDKHLKNGIPNKDYFSDHLPTQINLEIDFGNDFTHPEVVVRKALLI